MPKVNIHQAKSTLSRLVAALEDHGEETVLCRAGKPVARLAALPEKPQKRERIPGLMAGQMEISDDFDLFLPSDAAFFGMDGAK